MAIIIVLHESRELKQARPSGQYVDLLRFALATPSQGSIITHQGMFVKRKFPIRFCAAYELQKSRRACTILPPIIALILALLCKTAGL